MLMRQEGEVTLIDLENKAVKLQIMATFGGVYPFKTDHNCVQLWNEVVLPIEVAKALYISDDPRCSDNTEHYYITNCTVFSPNTLFNLKNPLQISIELGDEIFFEHLIRKRFTLRDYCFQGYAYPNQLSSHIYLHEYDAYIHDPITYSRDINYILPCIIRSSHVGLIAKILELSPQLFLSQDFKNRLGFGFDHVARFGSVEMMRFLLERVPASISFINWESGTHLLHNAAESGNLPVIKLLCEWNYLPPYPCHVVLLSDRQCDYPINLAMKNFQYHAVAMLIPYCLDARNLVRACNEEMSINLDDLHSRHAKKVARDFYNYLIKIVTSNEVTVSNARIIIPLFNIYLNHHHNLPENQRYSQKSWSQLSAL